MRIRLKPMLFKDEFIDEASAALPRGRKEHEPDRPDADVPRSE